MIIREAKSSDLTDILEIEVVSFGSDSFSKKQFIYLITKAKGAFYVVQDGEKVVAYISLSFHSGTRNLRIYSIAVHPDYRSKKLGQVLIDKAIEFARTREAKKITLEVKVSNTAAIRLYQKNGFEPISIKCNYYHDGSDAYYMQRT